MKRPFKATAIRKTKELSIDLTEIISGALKYGGYEGLKTNRSFDSYRWVREYVEKYADENKRLGLDRFENKREILDAIGDKVISYISKRFNTIRQIKKHRAEVDQKAEIDEMRRVDCRKELIVKSAHEATIILESDRGVIYKLDVWPYKEGADDDDDEFDIYIPPTEINKRVTLYPRVLSRSVKIKDGKLAIGESGDLELDFELEHYGYTLIKERYMGGLNFSAKLRTGEYLIDNSQIEVLD